MMTYNNYIIVPRLSTFVRKHASDFGNIKTMKYKESISVSFNQYLTKALGAKWVSPVIYRNHYYDNKNLSAFLCHGYYVEWGSSLDVIHFLMENDVSIKHDIYWCFP